MWGEKYRFGQKSAAQLRAALFFVCLAVITAGTAA
jgi:hypothetical protein